MKIIEQSHEILTPLNLDSLLLIEKAGRTCYKSEDQIKENSAEKFVKMILNRGHETVIEHATTTVRFTTNRGVTHELVRHRLASYSQESTRYVRYDGYMEFIKPIWFNNIPLGNLSVHPDGSVIQEGEIVESLTKAERVWLHSMWMCECSYIAMLAEDQRPEQAREVLPNSLKTEIVMTANLREYRHMLNLRCSKKAHPQISALMLPLLAEMFVKIPIIFDNLAEKYEIDIT